MYCPNCGKERLGPGKKCDHCGYVFDKKPLSRRWWFWLIVVILCLPGIFTLSLLPFLETGDVTPVAVQETSTAATEAADAGPVVYGEGMYRVGVDIPAGEYKVTSTETMMAYYEVTSDSTGSIESRITNESFSTFAYVTVADGQYLKVDRAEFSPVK